MVFPTTSGSMCAIHPDRPASSICERCGNFECDECNDNRTRVLCPACNALGGAGQFPLSRDAWNFDALWGIAWGVFKRDWVMLSVAVLIFLGAPSAVNAVGGLLQGGLGIADQQELSIAVIFIAFLLQMVVQGIFEMGAQRIYLDTLQGGKADVGRIGTQVSKLWRYIGQKLIISAVALAAVAVWLAILAAAVAAVAGFPTSFEELESTIATPAVVALLVGSIVLLIVPMLYVTLPLYFSTPELVFNEGVGVVESIQNCYAIAKDNRLAILGISLVAGLVGLAGVFACCIGVLPGIALGQLLMSGLYLSLRTGSGLKLGSAAK